MRKVNIMLTNELIYKKLKEDENGCIFEYDGAIYFFDIKNMGLKKLDIQNNDHISDTLANHEKINELFESNLISETNNASDVCDVKWISKKNIKEVEEIKCYIYLTKLCNMNCEYCFEKKFSSMKSLKWNYLEFEKRLLMFKSIYPNLKKIAIQFYGGEPWIEKRVIFKIVQNKKNLEEKLHLRLVFGMNTNGTLLTNSDIKWLVENNVRTIISFDGISDNSKYRKLKDGKSTDILVLEKIEKYVKEMKIQQKDGERLLVVNLTMSNSNSIQLNDICDYLAGVGVEYVTYGHALAVDNTNSYYVDQFLSIINTYDMLFKQAIDDINSGVFVNKITTHYFRYYSIIKKVINKLAAEYPLCGAGRNHLTIGCDGNIYMCPTLVYNDFLLGGDAFKIKEIIEKKFESSMLESSQCNKCSINKICGGGCFADNFYCSGDINKSNSSWCELEKNITLQSLCILIKIINTKYDDFYRYFISN